MRKTGIIFLVLMGITTIFLLKALNSGQSHAQQNPDISRQPNYILQQIPTRLAKNTKVSQPNISKSTPNISDPPKTESSSAFENLSSQEILARLIGKWEQTKSNRKQILTINENGTATMVVEPKGFWKTVLGAQISIDIEWSLDAGTLTLRTIGGNPENKLEYIKQVWGDQFTRKIHTIEDKMFTLRDEKGKVSQNWIRTSY